MISSGFSLFRGISYIMVDSSQSKCPKGISGSCTTFSDLASEVTHSDYHYSLFYKESLKAIEINRDGDINLAS